MPPAIPKGLEDYLAALMERSLHDALIFSERIAKATSVMSQAGMSADAIAIALNEDLIRGGKIFGELSNSIKSGINEGINQSGRLGQAEQYPPGDQNYSWITVAGHKVCPDCDARTGDVKTWDEWVGEGLPGSGWSICGGHCYCVLDPVGKWESRIEGAPPAVKEPGASLPRPPVDKTLIKKPGEKALTFQTKPSSVSQAMFNKSESETLSYLRSLNNKEFNALSQALHNYTSFEYEGINAFMRGAKHTASDIAKRYPFTKGRIIEMKRDIKVIQEFLNKAPRHKGTLFRTQSWYGPTNGPVNETLSYLKMKKFFQNNTVFTNKQFMSTSPELMEGFASILDGYKINFKILNSKSGANIGPMNGLGQREILLPPGTRFRIVNTKLYTNVKSGKFIHREILEVTLEEF